MISVGDLRPGITFEYEGNLYVVLDYSHNKTARAAANIKVKMKNMRSGATTEITFGGNDKVKKAHIDKRKMQYLYNSGDALVFMDNETYDQIELTKDQLGSALNFLKENMDISLQSFKGNIIGITLPNSVNLEVVECEPSVKGDTATGATKMAKVETGYEVRVPLFVNEGDVLRIDTRTGNYIERA